VVWHHHNADAAPCLSGQLGIEHGQDDFLGSVDVEQTPALAAAEREEVGVAFCS
jgi:hypothetical protein